MNNLKLTIIISAEEEQDIFTGEKELRKALTFEYDNNDNQNDYSILTIDNNGFLALSINEECTFTDYTLNFVSYICGAEVTKNDLDTSLDGSYRFMPIDEDVERWNRAVKFINNNKLKVNYSEELSFSEGVSNNIKLKK